MADALDSLYADALDSLYKAFTRQLKGATPWGDEVYPDAAPSWAVRPLVVFNNVVGGDTNRYAHESDSFMIDVKCIVDDDYETAKLGAAMISALLKDKGYQDLDDDGNPGPVAGDSDYLIKTITRGARIHILDDLEKTGKYIYYSGHTFTVEMEEII